MQKTQAEATFHVERKAPKGNVVKYFFRDIEPTNAKLAAIATRSVTAFAKSFLTRSVSKGPSLATHRVRKTCRKNASQPSFLFQPSLTFGWHALRLCEGRVDLCSNHALRRRRLRACYPNTFDPKIKCSCSTRNYAALRFPQFDRRAKPGFLGKRLLAYRALFRSRHRLHGKDLEHRAASLPPGSR